MLPFFLACTAGSPEGPSAVAPGEDPAASEQVAELGEPLATADVLVIGSGSSGLVAALSAWEAGADVMMVELAAELGGNGGSAGQQFAVGTRWQAEAGVDDSADAALAEWATFTGGDGDDPNVQAFVRGSADTMEWLAEHGLTMTLSPGGDPGAGSVPRVHNVFCPPGTCLVDQAAAALGEEAWVSTRAVSLVVREGRVVGAEVEREDGTGWIEAGEVIVASGGFARNDELMEAARPALAARSFVYEAGPLAVGAGAGLVPGAGGTTQNLSNYGMYLHSAADPVRGAGRESLQLTGLESGLLVTPDGQRFGDESGFDGATAVLDAGFDHAWVLIPTESFWRVEARVPGYNWVEPLVPEQYDAAGLEAIGVARSYASAATFAHAADVPVLNLDATLARYGSLVEIGADADYGKEAQFLVPFTSEGFVVIELRPGAAKAFGGARTDASMRALDAAGDVIPGLYVVGEAAGFLGSEAVGWGFTGSSAACEWGGLVAGRAAAGG